MVCCCLKTCAKIILLVTSNRLLLDHLMIWTRLSLTLRWFLWFLGSTTWWAPRWPPLGPASPVSGLLVPCWAIYGVSDSWFAHTYLYIYIYIYTWMYINMDIHIYVLKLDASIDQKKQNCLSIQPVGDGLESIILVVQRFLWRSHVTNWMKEP